MFWAEAIQRMERKRAWQRHCKQMTRKTLGKETAGNGEKNGREARWMSVEEWWRRGEVKNRNSGREG